MILTKEDLKTAQQLIDDGWSWVSVNDRGEMCGQIDVSMGLLGTVTVSYLSIESHVMVFDGNDTDRVLITFNGSGYCLDIVRHAKRAMLDKLMKDLA